MARRKSAKKRRLHAVELPGRLFGPPLRSVRIDVFLILTTGGMACRSRGGERRCYLPFVPGP